MKYQPMKPARIADSDLDKLRYPLIGSAKVDGIRALVVDKTWYAENVRISTKSNPYLSRARRALLVGTSMKPIPNTALQAVFDDNALIGLDGELVAGPVAENQTFRDTTSAVSRVNDSAISNVRLHAFDIWNTPDVPFVNRTLVVRDIAQARAGAGLVVPLEQRLIVSLARLEAFERETLEEGFEGVVTRNPQGLYRYGRGTLGKQDMVKIKRFHDAEAVIVGFVEQMHNANELERDERGYAHRSQHSAGKTPKGTLGALKVRQDAGEPFQIGTGFTAAERDWIWERKTSFLGLSVKFKFLDIGGYNRPRHPVFLGIRAHFDISPTTGPVKLT